MKKHQAYSRSARRLRRLQRDAMRPSLPATIGADIESLQSEVKQIHLDNETTIRAIRRLETQLCRRAG